ncbi:MAG TPA: hydroxymethylbilane synthase [Streptosporangiaceae bacterium]|nr:hydroxymethylbilane synthase [Streptosporangiaceae bacterium]
MNAPVKRPALRLGTRRSLMAMTQAGQVAKMITARTGRTVELVGVTTFGDVSKADLVSIGGTGVFVNTLRERLLAGEVDLAVHSLKDLPTARPDRIVLAALPPRDDPRDVLAARGGAKLADLPAGARIGTGSTRRVGQLRAIRRDLNCVPIRGNADTRLTKVASGDLDAVVLAYAGLIRIGRQASITQIFEPDEMLPAPGQGALAVECRGDDAELVRELAAVDDQVTRAAVTAERSLLAALEAGCSAPVGAYAAGTDVLHLQAVVLAEDGSGGVRLSRSGPADTAEQLGRQLAAELLARGAAAHISVHGARSNTGEHAT